MLAVQPVRRVVGNEELAAVGGRTGVGHSQDAGAIEGKFGHDLILEGVTGAAGAGAGRIARLRHKALDDTVERRVVIVAQVGQRHEVVHCDRRLILEQINHDVALVGDDARGVVYAILKRHLGWDIEHAVALGRVQRCQRAVTRRVRSRREGSRRGCRRRRGGRTALSHFTDDYLVDDIGHCDSLCHIQPVDDQAESRIDIIDFRHRLQRDVELAAIAEPIRIDLVRQAQITNRTGGIGKADFGCKVVAGAAIAVAGCVTGQQRHGRAGREQRHVVVVTHLRQHHEVVRGDWRLL